MVICPRAELESAVLLVEGKMFDLDLTGTFVDGWRKPVDAAIEKNNGVGEERYFVRTISTVKRKKAKPETNKGSRELDDKNTIISLGFCFVMLNVLILSINTG